ncbi:MAG: type II secretion system protein [Luteolibacter sp.]
MNPSLAIRLRKQPTQRGFTLPELLVVIAIIVILAALSVTIFSKARASAGRATAVNAMRQLGVAIFSYAAENNNYLPPGQNRQGLWLSHDGYNQNYSLFGFLSPYIGVEPKSNPQPVLGYVSSTHLRLYPNLRKKDGSRIAIYASSRSIEVSPGVGKPVFGYYGDWGSPGQTSGLSLSQVQGSRRTQWKWLLQEADLEGGWSAPWDAPAFPNKPVHGNIRHRLGVDGNVEALSLEASNLY